MAEERKPRHHLFRVCIPLVVVFYVAWLYGQAAESSDAIDSALRSREFVQALKLIHRALQQNSTDPRLWALQGKAYAEENRSQEALESFRTALKIAPDSLTALQGAAQIEFNAGSPRAIPLIARVLEMRPGDVTSRSS